MTWIPAPHIKRARLDNGRIFVTDEKGTETIFLQDSKIRVLDSKGNVVQAVEVSLPDHRAFMYLDGLPNPLWVEGDFTIEIEPDG